MALYVKFWGTRGSIPTPGFRTQRFGGNTSCVEIRGEQAIIICDAGSGLRELGMDIMRRFGQKPVTVHLFLSHTHWDHIQGFPFFVPAYLPGTTIYVYGDAKADQSSYQLLTGQMESAHFPVTFSDLAARIFAREFDGGHVQVENITVGSFAQVHPGGSLGFSFTSEGQKVVYSTDNELDQRVLNAKALSDNVQTIRQFPAEVIDAVRGADLLIADTQYTDAEYAKKIGWGHASTSAAVDLAVAAEVKQLALFHHDPMQSDGEIDQKVAACNARLTQLGAKEKVLVFAAREGMELKIV